MGNGFDLDRYGLEWLWWESRGYHDTFRDGAASPAFFIRSAAFFDFLVCSIDETSPSIQNNSRIVVVCCVVDEQADVVVPCWVGIVIVQLRAC